MKSLSKKSVIAWFSLPRSWKNIFLHNGIGTSPDLFSTSYFAIFCGVWNWTICTVFT